MSIQKILRKVDRPPPTRDPCDDLDGDEREFGKLIPELNKQLVWSYYVCEEQITQADTLAILNEYGEKSVSRRTVSNWSRRLENQFELWRDPPLDEIEERTGSPAKPLRGALADTGSESRTNCPDEIAGFVAAFYALTRCGRLFHWRKGELEPLALRDDGRFKIAVNGVEWYPTRGELLDRAFPQRGVEHVDEIDPAGIDWSATVEDYRKALEKGEDPPLPALADDPLRDKQLRDDSVVLKRPPTEDQQNAAINLLYAGDPPAES